MPTFSRRDQIGPAVRVLAQHGREKLHQRHAADRRAEIEPCSVRPDFNVDVAAEIRVPALYRRQALAGARRARHKRFEAARIAGTGKAFVGGTARLGWGVFGHGHEIVTVGALVSRGR